VVRASAPVPGGPAAIRKAASQILSRPEFRPTPQTPIERARKWLSHQVARIINDVITAGPHGVIGALLALVVVAALVFIIVRAVLGTSVNPVRDGFALDGPRRPMADWLAEAARCEAAGDWRGALRSRYRGLVAELAHRGLVEEIPGRTTGEYRRAVDHNLPNGSAEFGDATDLFEGAWYGDQPTAAPEAERFRTLAQRVLERAR
jgi:hypothetical protein